MLTEGQATSSRVRGQDARTLIVVSRHRLYNQSNQTVREMLTPRLKNASLLENTYVRMLKITAISQEMLNQLFCAQLVRKQCN